MFIKVSVTTTLVFMAFMLSKAFGSPLKSSIAVNKNLKLSTSEKTELDGVSPQRLRDGEIFCREFRECACLGVLETKEGQSDRVFRAYCPRAYEDLLHMYKESCMVLVKNYDSIRSLHEALHDIEQGDHKTCKRVP